MIRNRFVWHTGRWAVAAVGGVAVCGVVACGPSVQRAATAPPPVADASFTLESRVLGEARRINVHVPVGYGGVNAVRLPVLYMPDGGLDEDFPHVVSAVDSLIARRAIRPVIVVGIPNTQRRRDLTGPTRVASDSAIAPRVGGSAAFRRFLRDEVIPAVEARYSTTAERAIIGESLAGLFVVETFLLEPSLFTHYAALDPSLWWDRESLVDSASARLRHMDGSERSLYLAASADGIGSTMTRLATALRSVAPPHLRWQFDARADLTHPTIFRGTEAAALVHSLR